MLTTSRGDELYIYDKPDGLSREKKKKEKSLSFPLKHGFDQKHSGAAHQSQVLWGTQHWRGLSRHRSVNVKAQT